jgi:hypothetical protein
VLRPATAAQALQPSDPSWGVVFACLTNLLSASFGASAHQSQVSDAVLAACR